MDIKREIDTALEFIVYFWVSIFAVILGLIAPLSLVGYIIYRLLP